MGSMARCTIGIELSICVRPECTLSLCKGQLLMICGQRLTSTELYGAASRSLAHELFAIGEQGYQWFYDR